MKSYLIAALIAIVSIFAATAVEAKATKYVVLTLPVVQYTEKVRPVPLQYDPDRVGYPKAIIRPFPHKRIWQICGSKQAYACAVPAGPGHPFNVINIDEALSGEIKHLILRHEYAHLNGWRH